jgi:hypothetical protein
MKSDRRAGCKGVSRAVRFQQDHYQTHHGRCAVLPDEVEEHGQHQPASQRGEKCRAPPASASAVIARRRIRRRLGASHSNHGRGGTPCASVYAASQVAQTPPRAAARGPAVGRIASVSFVVTIRVQRLRLMNRIRYPAAGARRQLPKTMRSVHTSAAEPRSPSEPAGTDLAQLPARRECEFALAAARAAARPWHLRPVPAYGNRNADARLRAPRGPHRAPLRRRE